MKQPESSVREGWRRRNRRFHINNKKENTKKEANSVLKRIPDPISGKVPPFFMSDTSL